MNNTLPSHLFEDLRDLVINHADGFQYNHSPQGPDEFSDELYDLVTSSECSSTQKAYKATANRLIWDVLRYNTKENGYYE